MRNLVRTFGLATAFLLLLAAPASAANADRGADDQVVLSGTLIVPAGTTVGAAVIFDGPATIDGTVEDALVVFHGDVVITGEVGRDVVVFDGDVTMKSGSHVGGDLVTTKAPTIEQGAQLDGTRHRITGTYDFGQIGVVSRIVFWIGYTGSTLILGLLLLLFAPRLDGAITRVVRARPGSSLGLGVGWFFLLPLGAVLFLITVVGVPLGVFLLLALAFLYTVGYTAGAHGVGRLLVRAPDSSRYVAFLAGWGLLRLLALIPVVGGLAWTLVSMFGLGILVRAARAPSGAEAAAMAPAPPPPPMPA